MRRVGSRHFNAGFLVAVLAANDDDGAAIGLRYNHARRGADCAAFRAGHRKTYRVRERHGALHTVVADRHAAVAAQLILLRAELYPLRDVSEIVDAASCQPSRSVCRRSFFRLAMIG